jgi:hypothetical protein
LANCATTKIKIVQNLQRAIPPFGDRLPPRHRFLPRHARRNLIRRRGETAISGSVPAAPTGLGIHLALDKLANGLAKLLVPSLKQEMGLGFDRGGGHEGAFASLASIIPKRFD